MHMRMWTHRRHRPFLWGGIAGLLALPVFLALAPRLAVEGPAIVFFVVYLTQVGLRLRRLTAERLKATAEADDAPAPVILFVTLMAVAAAIIALFNAMNRAGSSESGLEVALAFASVVLGWLTVHTMFSMHYAHLYWRPLKTKPGAPPARGKGLNFPGDDEPGAYDFLYFGFVIGMTAQTSDVEITETAMRRINLAHSLVSFFFNTVLVAAAVNAVVSLAN